MCKDKLMLHCSKWRRVRHVHQIFAFRGQFQHIKDFLENLHQTQNLPIIISALRSCGILRALDEAKLIYMHTKQMGATTNVYMENSALDVFAKCGRISYAQNIFDRMPCHTVVSWNSLVLGYVENGEEKMALKLFSFMQAEPNSRTLVAALKACSSLATQEDAVNIGRKPVKLNSLKKGMEIHSRARDCDPYIFVTNSLIDLYAKCGSMVDSRRVFDTMLDHDTVSWNALILGYAENGEEKLALKLFSAMEIEPNSPTFIAAVKACTNLAMKEDGEEVDGKLVKVESLEAGRNIHSQALDRHVITDVKVAGSLMDMYAKCGCMVSARRIFDTVNHLHNDIVLWNILMLGYVDNEEGEVALELFGRVPVKACSSRTFVAASKACVLLAAKEQGNQIGSKLVKVCTLEKGMQVHSRAIDLHFERDIYLGSTLIDMYVKCGSLVDAYRVFRGVPYQNVVLWNTMIHGCVENDEAELAWELFTAMDCKPDALSFVAALKSCVSLAEGDMKTCALERGRDVHSQVPVYIIHSDKYIASTLVDLYAKCGCVTEAHRLLETVPGCDKVSRTLLMASYVENAQAELALELFAGMKNKPDVPTFGIALKACVSLVSVESGKAIHMEICRCGCHRSVILATSLVDFYAKCGCMKHADYVFNSVHCRDEVSLTALVSGCSLQGDSARVFEYFDLMEEELFKPNGVTLLCVLSACGHAGLVSKGRECFESMRFKYGVEPGLEHYACMIDMLARANEMEEALEMVKNMPYEANKVVWTAVLGACSKWKNVEVGRYAFHKLVDLDKDGITAAYSLMGNIYKSVGMWEEHAKLVQTRDKSLGHEQLLS